MSNRLNRVVSLCALAVIAGSCAGRQTNPRAPYGPVTPESLEEFIRATNKVGTENARREADKNAFAEADPAVAALLVSLRTDPNNLALKAEIADVYYRRQLYRQAYDLLMGLHSSSPEDAQTNLKLAHIWDVWEQYGLALQHADRAIAAGVDTAEAYGLMGRIQLHLNKPDTAIVWYRKSLEKDDRDATVLANLGYAYILQSDWEQAGVYLEAALTIREDMPEVHNNLAAVLARAGDNEGALQHLMQAATPAVAMNNMGVLSLQQDRQDDAIRYFREALRLDPSYTTAERNLQTTRRMTPPPSIIQLPPFEVVSEGPSIAQLSALPPSVPRDVPAVNPPAEPGDAARVPAPAITEQDAIGASAASIDGPVGHQAEFKQSAQDPPQKVETSRSAVRTELQRRARLNLAGFAGLILLTGWLAFRARKARD